MTMQSLTKPKSMIFYSLQIVGLIFEDLAIRLWNSVKSLPESSTSKPNGMNVVNGTSTTGVPLFIRLIGYVWVVAWLQR